MRRAIYLYLLLLLTTVACLPQLTPAHAAEAEPLFLWRVQGDSSTVYLFGSIHFARADFYPLDSRIEQAFDSSSALAVEIDVNPDNMLQTQLAIQTKGMYQGDDNLLKHLDTETTDLLKDYSEHNQIPLSGLIRLKPGILSMSLSAMHFVKLGFTAEHGLDLHFLNKARGNKPIIELETFDSQLALMLDESYDKLTLRYTLLSLETMDKELDSLLAAWNSGQAQEMEAMAIQKPLQEAPELKPLFQRLYFDRNHAMARRVEQFLKDNINCFVVVGAAHLVGKQGLVQLLQARGYTVTQM